MEIKSIDKILSSPTQDSTQVKPPSVAPEKTVNPFQSTDTTISKPVVASPDGVFGKDKLTPMEGHYAARNGLLNYFKNNFMNTPEFKTAFGNKTWDDVGADVIHNLTMQRDKTIEQDQFGGKAYFYKVEIYGMYGEVAVDKKTGALKKSYVEID